ncbi:MAG: outer membrane lipoprotein LolB [Thiotrichales bacterium]|nr:MAG: outer membrane lipoprotein LolB [Thiotrichales bacterium]
MTAIQQAHRSVARFLLLYLLISILGACASLTEQVVESPADWEDRLQRLQQIDNWTIKARLGVQTETEGGSFDVFWQQQADRYDIRLVAPMGQGAVHIVGDDGGVTISLADGRSEYSDNAEELFHAMTGLSLPVNGLRDWLRGIPIQHEAIQNISWNENGQLYKIEQTGWQVEMGRYKVIADHDLPHAFYLGQEQRPELSVRLLVREWQPAQ